MNEINLQGFIRIRVGILWPWKGIWVWAVPDQSKERALKEPLRIFDGFDQKSVAVVINHSWVLLSSGDNVFDII